MQKKLPVQRLMHQRLLVESQVERKTVVGQASVITAASNKFSKNFMGTYILRLNLNEAYVFYKVCIFKQTYLSDYI